MKQTCVVLFFFSPHRGEPDWSDMVIFFEWHWTSMEPKSGSGLPMSGEEAGLEALASPLAGYLGKVSRAQVFLLLLSLAQS